MRLPPFKIGVQYTGIGLDPLFTSTPTILSSDRLTAHAAGGVLTAFTVKGFSTGLIYCEMTCNSGTHPCFGVANHSANRTSLSIGQDVNGWSYISDAGTPFKVHNNVFTSYGSSYTAGDTVGCALDMINGFVYWRDKTGAWINAGDPTSGASGTNAAYGGLIGTLYFTVGSYNGNAGNVTINTGAISFTFTPPTGYSGF